MKGYPKDIEKGIGFDEIRALISGYCQSEKGEELVKRVKPTSNSESLEEWHNQTKEMFKLDNEHRDKVQFNFSDIESLLTRIKIKGSFLVEEDLHQLKVGLETLISWLLFFNENGALYPNLFRLVEKIELDHSLAQAIDRIVDEKGELRDNASPELQRIRNQLVQSERAVRSAIQKVLKKAKSDALTDEDSSLTIRDGRLVIPIKSEHKKKIAGFVHDESATGQTVYLEPGEVLELNNSVRELQYAERREIIRILIQLADLLRENYTELEKGVSVLEKLDFIYAKTRLGKHIDGIVPSFSKRRGIQWVNATHPLLKISHQASGKQIVPLSLSINENERVIVVSGPNAGGKSVVLKTVGLLQYMFQCGLPVPVGEESEFGIFSKLFLDIGDAQSIADDLSTYSSHLSAMKHFVTQSDKGTLFLIDEFGKGTEPQFGGAIAGAILESIVKNKAYGIVTTHYQNLKNQADSTSGMVNAAMKYDADRLEPLFELEIGKPGSSFALEIAQKIGLPKAIVDAAKKQVGASHVAYDQELTQLEKERSKYEKASKEIERERNEFTKVRKDYEELRELLEVDRKRVIKEAKEEAQRIVKSANKDVERVIREIKESKAATEKTKQLRKELASKEQSYGTSKKKVKEDKIAPGDAVRVIGQETSGIVQKVNGNQVEVLFGNMKSVVSVSKLEKTKKSTQQKHQQKVKKLGIDVHTKMTQFSHELDIRGIRAEEAIGKVESFIDEAVLVGINEVRILHGKGHGVLREIVRTTTKGHPSIASVADEHADRGGAGISIITLK